MPELAEVEFYRKQWDAGLHQKILGIELHREKRIFRDIDLTLMSKTITGATLTGSQAHGKQMLFGFSKGAWLGLHLGMTGKLRTEPPRYSPLKHDHLVLRQKKQALVFSDPRLFGRILFHRGADEPAWWTKLPPTLDSHQFTLSTLTSFLKRHGRAPIKAVLLLQNGFPGIGNWMADEILWQARIHPRMAAGKIPGNRLKILFQKTRFIVKQALAIIGNDFSDPPNTWLFKYRWKKHGDCPRCASQLKHATIGGRTTCWCPKCQIESPAKSD